MAELDLRVEITPTMIRDCIRPVFEKLVDDVCALAPQNPTGASRTMLVWSAVKFSWTMIRIFSQNGLVIPWRKLGCLILQCASWRP